jgi:hypothetical protein
MPESNQGNFLAAKEHKESGFSGTHLEGAYKRTEDFRRLGQLISAILRG